MHFSSQTLTVFLVGCLLLPLQPQALASTIAGYTPRRALRRALFRRRYTGPSLQQETTTIPIDLSNIHTTTTTRKSADVHTVVGDISRHFESAMVNNGQGGHQVSDLDTEKLLAALRQVENGLRKAGQKSNANNLSSNIQKIENMYQQAPAGQRETVISLLQYEKNKGLHEPSGHLSDGTAAMGLLWVRRSISFQHHLYSLVLNGVDPHEAAVAAYHNELEPYHGWPLRRVSMMALKSTSAVPRRELLAQLSGMDAQQFGSAEEMATENDLTHLLNDVWQPMLSRWTQIFATMDLEDTRKA